MNEKDRHIFYLFLVSTCLGIVHSASIRSENTGSTDPPTALPYEMNAENIHPDIDAEAFENDYEIVSPVHIKGSRRKRHAAAARDKIEYRITVFGEEFSIMLTHNDKLLSPGCVKEERVNGIKMTSPCIMTQYDENESDGSLDENCFYHGYSRNHNDSIISMALCSGMRGIIRVPKRDHDLIVQPINKEQLSRMKRSTTSSNPHLIYRKRRQTPEICPDTSGIITIPERETQPEYIPQPDDSYLELLLVADDTMSAAYGDGLTQHMLINANIVAGLFLDPSLGRQIVLIVVKIIILDEGNEGLSVLPDVRFTLPEFCEWSEQRAMNDPDPINFDTAALFTKLDLERDNNKHVSGYAKVGGTCLDNNRCSINQDVGFSTGFILAHEVGHNLGMYHDGTGNDCPNSKYIMGPSSNSETDSTKWSSCSADYLNTFLRDHGSCMWNMPSSPYDFPQELPGVLYDGNEQCVAWLGPGYFQLTDQEEYKCQNIACAKWLPNGGYNGRIKYRPLLDGTTCGTNKHCIGGHCVPKN